MEYTPFQPSPERQPKRFEALDSLAHLAIAATSVGLLEPSSAEYIQAYSPEIAAPTSRELTMAEVAILHAMRIPANEYELAA